MGDQGKEEEMEEGGCQGGGTMMRAFGGRMKGESGCQNSKTKAKHQVR